MKLNTPKHKRKLQSTNLMLLPLIILLIIVLLLLFSISSDEKQQFSWKGIRKEIKDTALVISRCEEVNMASLRQKWFKENASINELKQLTDFPDGTVKTLSYEALLSKKGIEQYPLFKKSLNDTLAFTFTTIGGFPLSEYLIKSCYELGEKPKFRNLKTTLTEEELSDILKLYEARKPKFDSYIKQFYDNGGYN